jgi:lysophospholipase L1-like esterase
VASAVGSSARWSAAGVAGAGWAAASGYWLRAGWSKGDGPLKGLYVHRLARTNRGARRGGIVFYGSSNVRTWTAMPEDLAPFTVVNRGFGGATDADLLHYAGQLLYPLYPAIACVHTGSNDLAFGLRLGQVLAGKRRLFATFRERLASTTFVVTSALPQPGRARDWPDCQAINDVLREYCHTHRDMIFTDATSAMTTPTGGFRPELYVSDGIHLNRDGQRAWASALRPVLERVTAPPAE